MVADGGGGYILLVCGFGGGGCVVDVVDMDGMDGDGGMETGMETEI